MSVNSKNNKSWNGIQNRAKTNNSTNINNAALNDKLANK